ncbi:MAG: DegT/DnrJ/EryC1/StrS family aminotransferase [Victivallales bacterium]
MTEYNIKWWVPRNGPVERKYLLEVLDRHFTNEGEYTVRFENEIARLTGAKFAVAVTSGTVAIFLSLKALGIGHGDEVIVPDLTFIATANAVDMCGARPVLADVETGRANISVDSIRKLITSRTKAIVPVHVSGRAAEMEKILDLAAPKRIHVVEDAAEALMSKHKGRQLGRFGISGCFSFSPAKTITTGQGGVIITDDEEFYKKLRRLKDQGRPVRGTGGDDIHSTVGYNFKFTDLQAAAGLGQLEYLEKRISRMLRHHQIYSKSLSGIKGFRLYKFNKGEVPQWTDAVVERRDELDKYLKAKGIDCRRFWLPIHTQEAYRKAGSGFAGSCQASLKSLWLPSAFTHGDREIRTVCAEIKEFFGER